MPYQQNKVFVYKWREANRDTYLTYMNEYNKNYRENHKEYYKQKRLANYYFKKECEIFRQILI